MNNDAMKTCMTCGMPLEGEHAGDIGMELPEGLVCRFDCENGAIKSGGEIFMGGVAFFADAAAGGDRTLAERLTRRNMKALPYWQAHPFGELDGEAASDQEFSDAMARL